jgi:hypothetical protein
VANLSRSPVEKQAMEMTECGNPFGSRAETDTDVEFDTTPQSVPQNVASFSRDGAPVHISLNAYTHLPTAVDHTGPATGHSLATLLSARTTASGACAFWRFQHTVQRKLSKIPQYRWIIA